MTGKSKDKLNKEEFEDLKNKLVRALADYDNLRKRVEKERTDFTKLVCSTIVLKLLPIFDMLEDAQKHLKDSGLAIVIGEFVKLFTEEGIERIVVQKGAKFDENLHEALEVVKGEKEGEIVEELLSGWKLKDGSVVRAAKVKVCKRDK